MNRELLLAEWRRSVRSLAAAGLLAREGYAEDAVTSASQKYDIPTISAT